jgi:hypothetical protein
MRNAYKILVEKSEGRRPLGRPGHRWKCNIRIDLMEMWWESVDLTHLAQDRDQWQVFDNTIMNFRVP